MALLSFNVGVELGQLGFVGLINSTGMGPIYDGLLHFLMSPEDLIPALALALLAGLRAPHTDGGQRLRSRRHGYWAALLD